LAEQPSAPPESGALASLRGLGASFVALVHTRVELAVVELREEAERRKAMVALAAAAAVFLTLAAAFLGVFVVVLFWDSHRLLAAGGVAALWLALGLGALTQLKLRARASPPPFEATLAELARDLEALKGSRAADE
jgi:uncharacterized membrane protein YqjE